MQEVQDSEKQQQTEAGIETDHVVRRSAPEIGTKRAVATKRKQERQRARDRLQLFQFKNSQFLDIGEVSV